MRPVEPRGVILRVDSADWNDAWIEVDGAPAGAPKLEAKDLVVSDGTTEAKILSIDSVRGRFRSHLAVSFVLDNSGSMFHAFDSLTKYCDSIVDSLPEGVPVQAVTFDVVRRTESHIPTHRPSVFIAQSEFRDSIAAIKHFWHFFDTIRSRYTPLYDAIAAAFSNIENRKLFGDSSRSDVVIVVTDGADNASQVSIEDLYDIVRTAHARLFTVNFRTGTDDRLVWLAHHTGGRYYYAENIVDLRSLLRALSRTLTRQYHVRYRFPSLTPSGSGE